MKEFQCRIYRGDLSNSKVPFPFYAEDRITQIGEVHKLSFDGKYTVAYVRLWDGFEDQIAKVKHEIVF
jgi:hypothetical protein